MVGVNPQHDAYGFRNWTYGPFVEYRPTGDFGRLEGLLAAMWSASFFVVGYVFRFPKWFLLST
jgi:amino acid transporter